MRHDRLDKIIDAVGFFIIGVVLGFVAGICWPF